MDATAIPAEVSAAIVTVMANIKTLGKEDTNTFQKYDFVSVDRFLEAVGPLCASAGLVILQEEDSVDVSTKETTDDYGKTKTSAWLTIRYAFTFAHSSGAVYGPLHRTVMVPANGAQAFGSAQSYALKQFMRAQFQIPTGDKDDADHQPATPLPNRDQKQGGKTTQAKGQQQSGQQTPFDGPSASQRDDMVAWIDGLKQDIVSTTSYLSAAEIWQANAETLKTMRRDFPDMFAELVTWKDAAVAGKPKDAA